MAVLEPVTLLVPGGRGSLPAATILNGVRWFGEGIRGVQETFYYGESGDFDNLPPLRREGERDAAETRAVADASGATRALGISRGARALVGLLAQDPGRFERVVLVVPPGDLRPPPLSYRVWLDSLPVAASGPPAGGTEYLVLGLKGDRGHPARTAEEWAGRLGARLEIFPGRGQGGESVPESIWGDLAPGYELMRAVAAEFLNA